MSSDAPLPKVLWHHGKCDSCNRRIVLVCHFGYDTQHDHSYRICLSCLEKHAAVIMYGWMDYKVDAQIDYLDAESVQGENE